MAAPSVVVEVPASAFNQTTLLAELPTPAGPVWAYNANPEQENNTHKNSQYFFILVFWTVSGNKGQPAEYKSTADIISSRQNYTKKHCF
jgi:hypothetical protein